MPQVKRACGADITGDPRQQLLQKEGDWEQRLAVAEHMRRGPAESAATSLANSPAVSIRQARPLVRQKVEIKERIAPGGGLADTSKLTWHYVLYDVFRQGVTGLGKAV